ncbi:MAG: transglycosylase SLT domain-containing protein [Chloroflexi bacterium]|nr:transglycosylase SLT domain-containing protein [Chloroflexota bacterium]
MTKRVILLLVLVLLSACSGIEPQRQEQAPLANTAQPAPAGSSAVATIPNDQLLALAADQRISGEYTDQTATLQQVLAQQPSAEQARLARWGLAESALLQGMTDDATRDFSQFLSDGQTDDLAARALLLLARTHENAGRWPEAIAAYGRYRELKTPLEPYAALRQAAQERAAGQIEQAIATYSYVAQQPIARGRRAEALERLIAIYGELGQTDQQLARYRELLGVAQHEEYRPAVLWRAAQLAGATDESRAWLREIIAKYPQRNEALEALAVLQNDPASGLTALQAANVNFVHGRHAVAVPLYDAALAGQLSDSERFEARHKRALSLREQALYDEALGELGALAQLQPPITGTVQAELDYIQTVGWSGNVPWAIDGYRAFAARFPGHELSPEALWRAIQLQESQGDTAGAMTKAIELGTVYPQSVQAHIALTKASFHYYLNNQRDQAITAWKLLANGAAGTDSAEGHFWAGNALVQVGQGAEAGALLQAATAVAPQSYYGMRARELLNQPLDGTQPLGTGPSADERKAVEAWIGGWFTVDVPNVGAVVGGTPEIARARELIRVNLRNESRDEWFAARDAWNNDPARLWQLALQAHDAGDPYVALKAAERIIELSPEKHITSQTPSGLLRLLYPTPYLRVIQREAKNFGVDPRLIYALMRQESMFNPDATSWVGARGLAQVMPGTGQGIAQNLQVADFSPDQLYNPAVSIRFGAFYLSHQLGSFDNNILAAASAYNGGPGNAARWLESFPDRDLFAELIDYHETRHYVKVVYGNWGMYRLLYNNQ